MWELIGKPLAEYLKTQSFNNVLIAALIGLFAADRYFSMTIVEPRREARTKDAHEMVKEALQSRDIALKESLKEHDAAAERQADRLISVMRKQPDKIAEAIKSTPVPTTQAPEQ